MRLIVKRNGDVVPYKCSKIVIAINKANNEMKNENDKATPQQIADISMKVELELDARIRNKEDTLCVEDIQDIVEEGLMSCGKFKLAREYIRYRHNRELVRRANTTDDSIFSLIDLSNKEVMEENSNKAAQVASTQRDLMAGEVSKDLTWRKLLPPDIVKAHEEAILHFHENKHRGFTQ